MDLWYGRAVASRWVKKIRGANSIPEKGDKDQLFVHQKYAMSIKTKENKRMTRRLFVCPKIHRG